MKAGIFIVGIVLISGLIASLIIKSNLQLYPQKPLPKRILPASVIRYSDPSYGFSFSYPSSYDLQKEGNKIILSAKNDANLKLIGNVVTTPTSSVRVPLLTLCHMTFNTICSIDSQTFFTNSNNTSGDSYYLSTASKSAELEKELKGPIYSFWLPSGKKVVLLFYSEDLYATDQEKDALKDILNSLSILIPTSSPLPTKMSSASAITTSQRSASSSAK